MLDLKTFLVLVLEMCGIAGFNFEDKDLVKKMCDSIWHRGPDDFGYYSDKFCTIGNRRLSIIDLKNGKTDLFVKNVRVKGVYSLYSYDLGIEEIASERNFANEEKVLSEVRTLLEGCANTEVIENVIKAAEKKIDHQLLELIVFRPIRQEQSKINELNEINKNEISESLFFRQIKILYDSDLWVRSFRKLYGENAILSSLNNFANGDAETMGYKVVKLDSGIAKYLQSKGIKPHTCRRYFGIFKETKTMRI